MANASQRCDVDLVFMLSPASECTDGAASFQRSWRELVRHNPGLLEQLGSVVIVSGSSANCAPTALCVVREELPHLCSRGRVVAISQRSMGRALSEAMLWCYGSSSQYCLVWDDAHLCSRPFWNSARGIMMSSPGVWQLALCGSDYAQLPAERFVERDGYSIVLPHPDESLKRRVNPDALCDAKLAQLWPSFTLSPALHSLAALRSHGILRFAEGEVSWTRLQWEAALRWEAAGGVLAVIEPPVAFLDYDGGSEEGGCAGRDAACW